MIGGGAEWPGATRRARLTGSEAGPRPRIFRIGAVLVAMTALSCSRSAELANPPTPATDLIVASDLRLPTLFDAAWPTCDASSAPTALVDGTTPGGPFHGRFAYLAFILGACPFPYVLVTESPLPPSPDGGYEPGQRPGLSDQKGLYIQLAAGASGYDWGGVQKCDITDDQRHHVTALCEGVQTGSPSEAGPGEGTIVADGAGWHLGGWFCAQRRADYDDWCLD